ncbi:MAG TPA: rubredoxin [Methanocorpusculum sp.]|nr:rubredoxin [Methanocorpusculum sp.]HJJ50025.1 rubredoxin [Methanocorpusculum sp.]HJJ54435.1 rubredoxin [Methanocorpusculum sp.]
MTKYICIFCAYIYDEEIGDPKHDIPAGTKYGDVPNSWKCPTCMISKNKPGLFRKIED